MIPVTDLIYNYDYAKRLHQGEGSFEDAWQGMLKIGGNFEKIYEESVSQILESIEKYSGFTWEENAEDFLPIYIVNSKPSFAHPLTLAVDEDPEIMLEDLICQLAHRNLYRGFATDELKKECLEAVTNHVMNDLGISDIKKGGIDLHKQSIKQYKSIIYGFNTNRQ